MAWVPFGVDGGVKWGCGVMRQEGFAGVLFGASTWSVDVGIRMKKGWRWGGV